MTRLGLLFLQRHLEGSEDPDVPWTHLWAGAATQWSCHSQVQHAQGPQLYPQLQKRKEDYRKPMEALVTLRMNACGASKGMGRLASPSHPFPGVVLI